MYRNRVMRFRKRNTKSVWPYFSRQFTHETGSIIVAKRCKWCLKSLCEPEILQQSSASEPQVESIVSTYIACSVAVIICSITMSKDVLKTSKMATSIARKHSELVTDGISIGRIARNWRRKFVFAIECEEFALAVLVFDFSDAIFLFCDLSSACDAW